MGQCAGKGDQGAEDLEAAGQKRALRPEHRAPERGAAAKKKGYGRAVLQAPAYLKDQHRENAEEAYLNKSKVSDRSVEQPHSGHPQAGLSPATYFSQSESYDALSQGAEGYPGDSRPPSLVSNATLATNIASIVPEQERAATIKRKATQRLTIKKGGPAQDLMRHCMDLQTNWNDEYRTKISKVIDMLPGVLEEWEKVRFEGEIKNHKR